MYMHAQFAYTCIVYVGNVEKNLLGCKTLPGECHAQHNIRFSKPHSYTGGRCSVEPVLKAKSIYKHCHACIFNCARSCRLDCISISSSSAVCFITPRPVTLWGFLVPSMTNVYSTTAVSGGAQYRSLKDSKPSRLCQENVQKNISVGIYNCLHLQSFQFRGGM